MKNRIPLLVALFSIFIFLPGCDVILGIFQAGFWTAIILVVLIVALSIYGYRKFVK